MANSSGVVLIINSQLNTAGLEAQVKQETLKLSKEATIKANLTIDNNGKSIQIAKQRISTFTNEAGQEVVKLTENISKNGVTVGKTVEMLGNKLKSTQPHIKSLKNSINDLFDTAGKVAKFSLITTALNTLSQAFTDGVQAVKAYDDALTDFQKVSDLSGDSLEKYAEKLGTLGESVARTRTEMVEGATGYKQSGYSDEDSAKLAQYSALLQNISDEEISASDATSFIISQLKAFGDQLGNTSDVGKQTLTVLDALNAVSNNYAVSSSNLEQGLKNLASTSSAMGNSYEQTLGMLTAVTEITRNASVASRGLRQIFSRLTQTLDDSSSTGKKLIAIYDELGIALQDENGQVRSSYDILQDLSKKWNTLSSNQKEYIAITSAGANQVNNFLALMTNFDTAVNATGTALEANGSAWEENEKYMKSIEALLTSLKSKFQEIVLGEGGTVSFAKSLLEIANGALSLIQALGGLPSILTTIITLIIAFKSESLVAFGTNVLNGIKRFVNDIQGAVAIVGEMGTTSLPQLGASFLSLSNIISATAITLGILTVAYNAHNEAIEKAKNIATENSQQMVDSIKSISDLEDKINDESTGREELDEIMKQNLGSIDSEIQKTKDLTDEKQKLIDKIKEQKNEEINDKIDEGFGQNRKDVSSINQVSDMFSNNFSLLEGLSGDKGSYVANLAEHYHIDDVNLNVNQTTEGYINNLKKLREELQSNGVVSEKLNNIISKLDDEYDEAKNRVDAYNLALYSQGKYYNEETQQIDNLGNASEEYQDEMSKLYNATTQNKESTDGYTESVSKLADKMNLSEDEINNLVDSMDSDKSKEFVNALADENWSKAISLINQAKNAVEDTDDSYNELTDTLGTMSDTFTKVSSVYSDWAKDGQISVSSFNKLQKTCKELKIDLTNFYEVMTDGNSTVADQQQAFDDLAQQIVDNSGLLNQLTEDNETYVVAQLKSMGIENADIVVKQKLANMSDNLTTSFSQAEAQAYAESDSVQSLGLTEEQTTELTNLLKNAKIDANGTLLMTDGDIANLQALGVEIDDVIGRLQQFQQAKQMALSKLNSTSTNWWEESELSNLANANGGQYSGWNRKQVIKPSFKPSIASSNGGGSRGGGSSSGKSDAEKAQEKALKAYKENAQKAFKENEHLYNMGQRSAKEYYEELARLNKQYYGETSKYASDFIDEFQSNEEKVYEGFKKLTKDALKAKKDAIKRQKKDLQDEQDDEEDYYNDRIDRLKEKEDDLTDAIEEQIDALEDKKDEISDYWEKRIDALDETNDKLERQIQLEKYEQALATARAKKVKVFKDGRFIWTSDQDAINSAQDELNTYKRKLAQEDYKKELESQRDAEIKVYEDEIDALKKKEDNIKKQYEEEIKSLQKRLTKIKKYYQEEEDELDDLGDAYDDMADKIESFAYDTNLSLEQNLANFMKWATGVGDATQQAISSMSKASEAEKEFASNIENFRKLAESGEYGNKTAEQLQWEYQYSHGLIDGGGSTSGGTTSSGGIGPGYLTSSGSTKSSGSSSSKGPGYSTSSGSSSKSSGGYTSGSGYASNGDKIVTKIVHRASGDASLSDDDIAVVGENPNKEIIIGSKLNNGVLMRLSKGTGVVNAQSTNTLAGMLNSLGTMNQSIGSLSDRTSNVNQNFHFDNLTLPNVNDANSFVKELSQRFNNYAIQYANVRK